MPETEKEWLGVSDLAEWLDVEPQTIYWMNSRGEAPPRYRIGRELRYRRREVEEWLNLRRVASGQSAQ